MSEELVALFAALAITAALTPACRWVARKQRIVDRPGGRKNHAAPTPYLGGLAVAAGLSAPVLLLTPDGAPVFRLAPAAAGALLLGVLDDVRELPAYAKVVGQTLVAVLALLALPTDLCPAFTLIPSLNLLLAGLLIVILMNAVNFADTFDGLCSLSAAAILAGAGWLATEGDSRVLAFSAAGACLGFVPWNLSSRAKIFLGDGGSLFLGLLVGALALKAAGDYERIASPAMVFLLLCGIPLVDATTVTVQRLLHSRPLIVGARDHLSHRLVAVGFPKGAMVAAIAGATAISALLAAAYIGLDPGWPRAGLAALAWILAALIVLGAGAARVYGEAPESVKAAQASTDNPE